MISCAPSKVLTKDNNAKQDKKSSGQEEKYDYNDEYIANNDAKDEKILREDKRDYDSGKQYSNDDPEKENYSDRPYDSQVNYSNEEKFYQKASPPGTAENFREVLQHQEKDLI